MPDNRSNPNQAPAIVLFRSDLRLADNKALSAALQSGRPVICAFVFDEVSQGVRPLGAARRWWLHHSLEALGSSLAKTGGSLVLRRGGMDVAVLRLVEQTGAGAVYWNRRHAPAEAWVDADLQSALRDRGIRADSFDGQLLHDPTKLKTGSGGSYKVFGAFRRALESQPDHRDPIDAPEQVFPWSGKLESDRLTQWELLPKRPDWAGGLREAWKPGEAGAYQQLDSFLRDAVERYAKGRDFPAEEATTRLSPHLAHGEITPFQILSRLKRLTSAAKAEGIAKLRGELSWREFCYHLLVQFPQMDSANYNKSFNAFPWKADPAGLRAWQQGRTGYPIVDAGMRQLWRTGWMHNRIRMVVASFLSKHLLIDWREGEKWFWDTLVDADAANNPANWQWVAGSGADASPYFRIFNPVLQGEKFDPEGGYTRRYVPELARLDDKVLHKPWVASSGKLASAGVKLGRDYPVPLIDHAAARDRALTAYKRLKGSP